MVTGKTKPEDRKRLVDQVKADRLRWLINVAVFTTGFDAPAIDTIVLLRATQSTSLYVQMIGRGLRLPDSAIGHLPSKSERLLAIASSPKPDALVLDYGENVQRHGPLNYLSIKEPGQKRDPNEIRAKDCPRCEILIPANARECPQCGYVFPIEERTINHATTAAEADLLVSKEAQWVEVQSVTYKKHTSKRKMNTGKAKPTMRVDYHTGPGQVIKEWVCFEHEAYAHTKALHWARARGIDASEMKVEDALKQDWPAPKRIKILKNITGYYDIKEYDWEG
jgi:DNA repair protein RadD